MKVVCNSSTLIALARIGHLDILEKEVKSLLIPRAVYEEVVVKGMDKPGAVEIREAKWIEERDVHNRELVMGFNTVLDLLVTRWSIRIVRPQLILSSVPIGQLISMLLLLIAI